MLSNSNSNPGMTAEQPPRALSWQFFHAQHVDLIFHCAMVNGGHSAGSFNPLALISKQQTTRRGNLNCR